MICPYWTEKETRVVQSVNDLVDEETGVLRGAQEVTVHRYTAMKCKRSGCAAWRDGACRYVVAVR